MIKQFITVAAMLLAVCANADERSTATIKRVVERLAAMPAYEVRFTARSAGQMPSTDGYYLVSGDSYYMNFDDKSVYADGKTKYEVDGAKKEVVISAVEKADRNILSNPSRAFDFLDGAFTHTSKGTSSVGTRSCEEISLLPTDKSNPVKSITLLIDAASAAPVAIKYSVDGMGAPIEIDINSLTPLKEVNASRFKFDRSRYKDFEMIDFR